MDEASEADFEPDSEEIMGCVGLLFTTRWVCIFFFLTHASSRGRYCGFVARRPRILLQIQKPLSFEELLNRESGLLLLAA